MKLDILCFGAHPDDVELGCSGTIAKHIKMGKSVGIIDLTRGEMGTRGSEDTRKIEADAAAVLLGVACRKMLNMQDSQLQLSMENKIEIAKHIRLHQPEILIINAPKDRHPDHGKACELVLGANFIAGLPRMIIMDDGVELASWRANACYSYVQDKYIEPSFVVDITEFFDVKIAAIKAFKSQFYDADSSEPETPISNIDFLPFVEARCREMGRKIKTRFGEGFIAHQLPHVDSLFDIV
jgi:bacillithiol biosynthesis deacetylase BshB1